MSFRFHFFGSSKPDADMESRRVAAEERIRQLENEKLNQQQALQSGSRRLRTMARTMALLRDGIDE